MRPALAELNICLDFPSEIRCRIVAPFLQPIERKGRHAGGVPGFVKRRLAAVGSKVVGWLREWTKPGNHGLVGGAMAWSVMR